MNKQAKGVATFRISDESKKQLKVLAKKEDRTISYLVNVAVREFLERQSRNNNTPSSGKV